MTQATTELCRGVAERAVAVAAAGELVAAYDVLTGSLHHAEDLADPTLALFWEREVRDFEAFFGVPYRLLVDLADLADLREGS